MNPNPPPYPKFPEQDENGVDLSLIREALRRTPIERVRRNYQAMLAMCRMREKIEPRCGASPDIEHLPAREGYDRWAAIYDVEYNPLVALEEPHAHWLLDDVKGLDVLDLGCGTGRHTSRLEARGANVTAIDFSQGMLQRARDKSQGFAVRFIEHDLAAPLPLPDQSFDRVLCSLVLDHVADLPLVFGEMRRVCRQGGSIVVSIMHPAMMLRGVQARFTDPETGRETRPQSQPHQISDYVMAALNARLTIDHLSEHAVDDELAARCPRAEKYLGWPLLLMMRLLRTDPAPGAAVIDSSRG